MSVDFEKAKDIFLEAVERSDSDERNAFLDEACGGDEQLRCHVDLLLDAHQQSGGFLDKGAMAVDATIDQPITEQPGTQIGPYKLLY